MAEAKDEYFNQISKHDAELTNKCSQLVIKDEELKSLKKEVQAIKEQLRVKSIECEDLKTRYRRRSEDNGRKLQELEMANNKLLQDVGAAEALKNSIENDFKKLKDEHSRILNECNALMNKNNDNDMKITILAEKNSQLVSLNSELENRLKEKINVESRKNDVVKKLEKEIVHLNEKIGQTFTENSVKDQLIEELREKCEKLIEENKFKPKKSSSPSHNRRSDEKELFGAQHRQIQDETNHGTPARTLRSNIDRKSRRQSVYDERRDLSAWELMSSESTQTDPVDKMCACNDLSEKIKELQVELRIKDSKIANAQRMANVSKYKYELEDAKKVYFNLKFLSYF